MARRQHIALLPQEVHVWTVTTELSPQQLAGLESILSDADRQHVHRVTVECARKLRMVARAALRLIVSRYLGVPVHEVDFASEPQGKPYLCSPAIDAPLTFNIAHSGSLALIALARSRRIGVDVELARSRFDHAALARRVCSPQERQWIESLPDRAQRAAFLVCWTCKEAYGKAIGKGLRFPLTGLTVSIRSIDGSPTLALLEGSAVEAHRWRLHSWSPVPNYFAALVAEGQDWHVRCLAWNWNIHYDERDRV